MSRLSPMSPTRIHNRSLSQHALETIRSKIVSGEYALGRKLPEAELAELLGVSKSPIREALLQLSREGLVDMAPSRSAQVFTMNAAEIEDLAELRQTLETKALQLAAERNPDALIAELQDIVARMHVSVAQNDTALYKSLDDDFHQALFRNCDNDYFHSNFERVSFRIQALRYRLSNDEGLNRRSMREHADILRLLQESRTEDARKLLCEHIDNTARNYILRMGPGQAAGPRRIGGIVAPAGSALVPVAQMERFCRAALAAVGADAPTVDAATRAMMHASIHGVDTHGVRLLPHYLRVIAGGRVNPAPRLRFAGSSRAVDLLDADNAHGARAAYAAMERAVGLAREFGIGAVAIRASSHFGAAGAYAVEAARAGTVGLVFGNSDSMVRLHGGIEPFHGTNPLAAAAPVPGGDPWLLDMATSAVPYNRIELSRVLGLDLSAAVASDEAGHDTTDPRKAHALAPLGGSEFGYKGAGLAGLAEILSSAFGNAPLSTELPAMASDYVATPRGLGAFVLAIDPAAFSGLDSFMGTMKRYLAAVRGAQRAGNDEILAPGDREWRAARRRRKHGVVADAQALRAFMDFAEKHGVAPPRFDPV